MNRVLLGAILVALIVPVTVAAAGDAEDDHESPRVIAIDFGDEVTEDGILVSRVIDDSPAQAAGIIRGDIVLAVDSTEVDTIFELQNLLADYEAGDTVEVLLSRGGQELTIELELETRLYRPAMGIEAAGGSGPRFNMMPGDRHAPDWSRDRRFDTPPDDFAAPIQPGYGPFIYRYFGDGDYSELMGALGSVVTVVEEGSPADIAGLLEGDFIVRVGDVELDDITVADAIADLAPGDTVEIEVRRPSDDGELETIVLSATLGSNDDGGVYLGIGYFPIGMRLRNMEEMFERFDGLRNESGRRVPQSMNM
jgi:membrane-associated protease RseP (regulator of RpoE activity)